MKKIKTSAIILLCLFTLHAHAEDFKVIDLEYTMPIDIPWARVITNQSEWLKFYFSLQGIVPQVICDPTSHISIDCSPPPPVVDFDNYQVIVGGLGLRNASSKIVVSDVDVTLDNELMINIIDLNPSDECPVIDIVDYTMTTIVVPKSDLPITFNVDEAVLKNCI